MWPNRMKRRQMWENVCYRLQQTSHNHDFKRVCQWNWIIRTRIKPEFYWNHNIYQNKTNIVYFGIFQLVFMLHHLRDDSLFSSQTVRRSCLVVSSQIRFTKNRRIQQNRVFRVRIFSRTTRTAQHQQESAQISRCVFASHCVRDVTSWRAEREIKPASVTNRR